MSYIALSTSTNGVPSASGFNTTVRVSAGTLTANRVITITGDDTSASITLTSTGINNTAIGATTSSTGAFTTLSTTGHMAIGTAVLSNVGLYIYSSVDAGGYGFYNSSNTTFTANSQTFTNSYVGSSTLTLAGFTGHTWVGLRLTTPILSGAGSLGTAYQLYMDAAPAATTAWNFFQVATNNNYLGGNLLIGGSGSLYPADKLEAIGGSGSYIYSTATQSSTTWAGFRMKGYSGSVSNEWAIQGGSLTGTTGNQFAIKDITAGLTRLFIDPNGNVQFNAYGAGTLTTDASGNITAVSDARSKDVIGPFLRGLREVMAFTPDLFRWNEASGLSRTEINAGFIAQKILPHIPEAVFLNNATGRYTMHDRPLIATLWNAVRQLNTELELLRSMKDPHYKQGVDGDQ